MRSGPPELFVGLMSGTSLDGVDAALIRTDGEDVIEPVRALTVPYDAELRKRLRACLGRRRAPGDVIADMTARNADAVRALMAATGHATQEIRAVGFHGQTILHRPADGITVQIGDGQWLADELSVEVVDQFRTADVAAGGEGAPFAPVYHRALLRGGALPAVMVNIGGVSNVTWTDGERLVAFDTGPGNARIDDWVMDKSGQALDVDGRLGLKGKVDEGRVAATLQGPFFQRPPPKSLDRDEIAVDGIDGASLADGAATLAALTGDAIAAAARWFPQAPARWVLAGGGRHNQAIVARLRKRIDVPVQVAENSGLDGDVIEAEMIAYLAARSLGGLPLSFPGTTGVPAPQTGGVSHRPRSEAA